MLKEGRDYKSDTARLKTVCGSLFITTVYNDEGAPIDVSLQLGKAGGCAKAHLSILSEYINLALKYGTGEAITALSSVTRVMCSAGDSCIDLAVQYIIEKILKASEE